MRRLGAALLLAALALAATAARAGDELPFNPFADAAPGDWCVLSGTPSGQWWRVTSVDGDAVTVSVQAGLVTTTRTFSKKSAPTVEALLGLDAGSVERLTVTDAKASFDGELACKKVTFLWRRGGKEDEVELWLSSAVKAGGVLSLAQKRPEGHIPEAAALALECSGWGATGKTERGRPPEDALDAGMVSVGFANLFADAPSERDAFLDKHLPRLEALDAARIEQRIRLEADPETWSVAEVHVEERDEPGPFAVASVKVRGSGSFSGLMAWFARNESYRFQRVDAIAVTASDGKTVSAEISETWFRRRTDPQDQDVIRSLGSRVIWRPRLEKLAQAFEPLGGRARATHLLMTQQELRVDGLEEISGYASYHDNLALNLLDREAERSWSLYVAVATVETRTKTFHVELRAAQDPLAPGRPSHALMGPRPGVVKLGAPSEGPGVVDAVLDGQWKLATERYDAVRRYHPHQVTRRQLLAAVRATERDGDAAEATKLIFAWLDDEGGDGDTEMAYALLKAAAPGKPDDDVKDLLWDAARDGRPVVRDLLDPAWRRALAWVREDPRFLRSLLSASNETPTPSQKLWDPFQGVSTKGR